MYEFTLNDPLSILGGTSSIRFRWPRALKLMAYATAPCPGSRYQPGSNWSIAKYATALEPRLVPTSRRPAIANSGIWDLDPHQKTVLADDMGVGLSLAAVDATYGIDGILDCYGLWSEGMLQLVQSGRHRRMPDFLILLRKPISGSRVVLLECKGSTRKTAADDQLVSACWQLNNVAGVLGISSASRPVPRIGIACMLHPGTPVELAVSDPPEELSLPDDIETRLCANYVALELAALGDVAAADSVRTRYKLPSWGRLGFETNILPSGEALRVDQTVLSILPGRKHLSQKIRKVVDPDLIGKRCVVRATLQIGPSRRAVELRKDPNNERALFTQSTPRKDDAAAGEITHQDSMLTGTLLRTEEDHADDGSVSRLLLDIRPVPGQ